MLQITTTPARLGMKTYNAHLEIQQPRGQQSIEQPRPEMKIDRELPKVIIDQYQCFAEMGLKNPTDLAKEISNWSRKKWLEGLARRREEGDRMARIEKGGNPIPEMAREKLNHQYQFNVDFIPKSRPKIEVTGHLNIEWDIKKPIINYKPNKPIVDYTPGYVDIYVEQWPDIEIRYVDERI